jgi:phosphotransferase system enzyme I (PtsP)
MATEGRPRATAGPMQFEFGQGLVGLVAERAEPVNLDHVAADRDDEFITEPAEEPYRGFLGVPVTHRGKVLGILTVRRRTAGRFDDADVAFLATLAAQLGSAIAYARACGDICGVCAPHLDGEHAIDGVPGAPGVAIGTAVVTFPPAELDAVPDRASENPHGEEIAFRAAVSEVTEEMKRLGEGLGNVLPAADQALFDAYAMLLNSPALVDATVERIRAGHWAPGALRATIDAYARRFEAMEDPYLRERGRDIRDLGNRLLLHLQKAGTSTMEYAASTVLVGQAIGAVNLAEVPVEQLTGVVSGGGSALSHIAILARAMGVPAVIGVGDLPLARLEGQEVAVDGYRGRVYVRPSPVLRNEFLRLMQEERALAEELQDLRDLPAETPDGIRVPLYANASLLADILSSLKAGAEGIGLYRTELAFMIRGRFPSEEEQRALYRQALEAFAPRSVTLRTLDAGGDKPLPYFPVREDNPMLGWRGIRMMLDHPDLFLSQLRAALRASAGLGNLNLLLPVVSGVAEVEEAKVLLDRAYSALLEEGVQVQRPLLGIMIEVPSAIYQVGELAQLVDFLSVGTNDLTQYLLAADRGNPQVARLLDPLHPAVLRALVHLVEAAHGMGRPVSVCGESAGDPTVALLLLGMGFDSLSVSVGDLLRIKRVIRSFTRAEAQDLVQLAVGQARPEPTRKLLVEALQDVGLGRLVKSQERQVGVRSA